MPNTSDFPPAGTFKTSGCLLWIRVCLVGKCTLKPLYKSDKAPGNQYSEAAHCILLLPGHFIITFCLYKHRFSQDLPLGINQKVQTSDRELQLVRFCQSFLAEHYFTLICVQVELKISSLPILHTHMFLSRFSSKALINTTIPLVLLIFSLKIPAVSSSYWSVNTKLFVKIHLWAG